MIGNGDYISREAAIELLKIALDDDWEPEYAADRLSEIPAADVRPVVLCRDCYAWNDWDSAGKESLGNFVCSCAHWSVEDGPVLYTRPDDFCSYGEKREESGKTSIGILRHGTVGQTMYDELVKRLRHSANFAERGLTPPPSELREAADAIEERCQQVDKFAEEAARLYAKLPRWIPVSERLPEAGERVLCYCRANIYEVMKMRTDGDWVHNDKVYYSAYMSGFVTHWMPLPEPPKEE